MGFLRTRAAGALRRAARGDNGFGDPARLRKLAKLLEDPERFLFDLLARRIAERRDAVTPSASECLRQNGFYMFRRLLAPEECVRLAAKIRATVPCDKGEFTNVDAANRFEAVEDLLFDPRVLGAVRACIGPDVRFLQISDLQLDHDHTVWHRDSAYRDPGGLDWDESRSPYRVVKILLYLESETAGLAVHPGSHLLAARPFHVEAKALQDRTDGNIVDTSEEINRVLSAKERGGPLVLCASPGDALVFDERLFHRGRRVSEGRVTSNQQGRKTTVSFVFGADNVHSYRIHSCFRYAREDVPLRSLRTLLLERLRRAGLVPGNGYANHYRTSPAELRGVWLRNPADVERLMAAFERST